MLSLLVISLLVISISITLVQLCVRVPVCVCALTTGLCNARLRFSDFLQEPSDIFTKYSLRRFHMTKSPRCRKKSTLQRRHVANCSSMEKSNESRLYRGKKIADLALQNNTVLASRSKRDGVFVGEKIGSFALSRS